MTSPPPPLVVTSGFFAMLSLYFSISARELGKIASHVPMGSDSQRSICSRVKPLARTASTTMPAGLFSRWRGERFDRAVDAPHHILAIHVAV